MCLKAVINLLYMLSDMTVTMEVWSSAHSKRVEDSKQIGTDIHHNVHVYKMLNLKE
jgi:hypothetical protein